MREKERGEHMHDKVFTTALLELLTSDNDSSFIHGSQYV